MVYSSYRKGRSTENITGIFNSIAVNFYYVLILGLNISECSSTRC
jgi:hypothetical protein